MTTSKSDQPRSVEKGSLTSKNIIRSSQEIGDLVRRGKRITGKYLSVAYLLHHGCIGIRVAFIATKKVKRAVDRNRLKRLMRETFRLHLSKVRRTAYEKGAGFSVVMIGNHTSSTISFKDIEKDFEQFILRIDKESTE